MPRYNQPLCLENLAVLAVSQYVKEFGFALITLADPDSRLISSKLFQHEKDGEGGCFHHMLRAMVSRIHKQLPFHHGSHNISSFYSSGIDVQKSCRQLQQMLHDMVTSTLANELTFKLLEVLNKIVYSMRYLIGKPWFEAVMQDLVTAIIHPAVTKLHLTPDLYYLAPMICMRWVITANLEELELSFVSDISDLRMLVGVIDKHLEYLIVTGIQLLVNLKTFRFPCNCTDSIVNAVCCFCRHLKCLDFHCSKVTDASIDSILNLQNLQELNVLRTSVTEEGCTQLLNKLSQNNVIIKNFGCSSVTIAQLEILIAKFSKLTHISLVSFECDLSLLKELENLQVLRLQSGRFSHVKGFIAASGWRLIMLELGRVVGVDIKLVGANCSSLDSITIRCCDIIVPDEISFKPLPGFVSLQHLVIQTKSDMSLVIYVLSHCSNVKNANILIKTGITDTCIESVLKRNKLHQLQELTLEMHSGQIPLSIAKKVIDHCLQLTLLKGVATWGNSNESYYTFLKDVAQSYPGVTVI